MSSHEHPAPVIRSTAATTAVAAGEEEEEEEEVHAAADDDRPIIRDIHALIPTPPSSRRGRRPPESWGGIHRSSSLGNSELDNLSTMSREFNAMVVAGSNINNNIDHELAAATTDHHANTANNDGLTRIGEEEVETNPLAIVPDSSNPIGSPWRRELEANNYYPLAAAAAVEEVPVHLLKREEVEAKISAWQAEEIAKINNRFKREDVVINGWKSKRVQKATTRLKDIERKLDEKRARAVEKMQNDVAKAHRKAEEKRAEAEAKRGTKIARVLNLANLMRAVGRHPTKRSFF